MNQNLHSWYTEEKTNKTKIGQKYGLKRKQEMRYYTQNPIQQNFPLGKGVEGSVALKVVDSKISPPHFEVV